MLNSVSSGRLSTFFFFICIFIFLFFYKYKDICYIAKYAMFHNLLAHIGLHTLDQIKYSMDNIARELFQIIMN